MTRANYLIMIRKLIAAYKKKYDAFGKEKKKNGSKKSRTLYLGARYNYILASINSNYHYL